MIVGLCGPAGAGKTTGTEMDIEEYILECNPSLFACAIVTPINDLGYEWHCKESEATMFRVDLVGKYTPQDNLWVCDTKDRQIAYAIAEKLQAWIDGIETYRDVGKEMPSP